MTSILRVGAAVALVCGLAASARATEPPAAPVQPTTVSDKNVARRISVDDLQKRIAAGDKPIILDTRFSLGDVMAKGAERVPNDQVESWAKGKPKDAFIVAYCT